MILLVQYFHSLVYAFSYTYTMHYTLYWKNIKVELHILHSVQFCAFEKQRTLTTNIMVYKPHFLLT
jgi:hypothetical protein